MDILTPFKNTPSIYINASPAEKLKEEEKSREKESHFFLKKKDAFLMRGPFLNIGDKLYRTKIRSHLRKLEM
jgi:hypothetical protein